MKSAVTRMLVSDQALPFYPGSVSSQCYLNTNVMLQIQVSSALSGRSWVQQIWTSFVLHVKVQPTRWDLRFNAGNPWVMLMKGEH